MMDAMDPASDEPDQVSDESAVASTPPRAQLLTRRSKRLSKRAQRRGAESSNEIVCPDYFGFLDRRLNTAEGSATCLTWFLRFIGPEQFVMQYVGMTVTGYGWTIGGVLTAKNALATMMCSSLAIATLISCTLLLDSLRRVIRPGEHLQNLGVGRVKLSARAARSLRQLRIGLRVPQAFFMAIGFFFVVFTTANSVLVTEMAWSGKLLWPAWTGFLGLWFMLVVPLMLEWWLTLRVASTLAADATIEVVIAAETIAPTQPDWNKKVVEPAKHLALDTMDELTHGWGRALAIAYGLYWILSLGMFAGSLQGGSNYWGKIYLALSLAFAILPLAMSTDPAAVSSSCDDLLTELNSRRGELIGHPEAIADLRDLEDYLNTLNDRQGCAHERWSSSPKSCIHVLHV
jgi:hypothetical protein